MLYVGQDWVGARSAVEDGYLGPGIMKLPNHMRADETRAADYQDLHRSRALIDGKQA